VAPPKRKTTAQLIAEEIVAAAFKLPIEKLKAKAWLNDDLINFFG